MRARNDVQHLLPKCKCGYAFPNLEFDIIIHETEQSVKYPVQTFTPSHCPNCRREIESITLRPGNITVNCVGEQNG